MNFSQTVYGIILVIVTLQSRMWDAWIAFSTAHTYSALLVNVLAFLVCLAALASVALTSLSVR